MTVVQLNEFLPNYFVDYAAIVSLVILAAGLGYKFRTWWRVVPFDLFKDARAQFHFSGLLGMLLTELRQSVIVQRVVFLDSKSRRWVHLAVFWGFVCLAVATTWDDIFYYSGTLPAPFTLQNFGNVIGNVGGALVLTAMTIIVLRYALLSKWRDTYKGDLTFLVLLYLATITGFTTEVFRFSPAWLADESYAVHLIFIGALVMTAPFTHFFHALLTPLMRYVGRVNDELAAKGVNKYPFYRRLQMANLAVDVSDGKVKPTYPSWLKSDKEEE